MENTDAPEQDKTVAFHKRRYDQLKGDRGNWEQHWEECAEQIMPAAVGFTGRHTPGEKRMQRVYDSTGIHSNELLAAGLHGTATNPASKWFSLRMQDDNLNEQPDVKTYLSEVEKRMWSEIYAPGTKFTTALHECYLSLGCFGTAIMFVGQRANGRLNFESRSLSECVLAENAEGEVDTVYRCYELTVRQVMQEKDWKPSDKVRALFEGNKLDEKIRIVHAVYPREDRDYAKDTPGPEEMAFASCYFEHDTSHKLSESGFPEFPYLCPRWSKYPGEIYGRSPGMTALPDIKMLNAKELTFIKALQKNADPPLWIRDDGVIHPQRTVPGGVNYYRGNPNDGVMLHPTNLTGINAVAESQEVLRNRIRTTFYTDILQIVTDQTMTATEVMQRTQERMRLLGPMVGRLEAELLGPLVTRVFGIMVRMQLLPPAPEEIQDQDFTVEYVSPIATAQKQTEVHGIVQVAQVLLQIAGPEMAPQLLGKRVSVDRAIDYLWDIFNNDPKLLKTEEEAAAEEEQAQAAMAAQAAPQIAGAANQATGAVRNLSQANAQEGTDLGDVMARGIEHVRQNPRLLANLRQAGNQAGIPQSEGPLQ
jgi:hypothetical protein